MVAPTNKDIGINFNEYVQYKASEARGVDPFYTSSDLYNQRQDEESEERTSSLLKVTAGAGASVLAYNYINNNEDLLKKVNKLPGASLLDDRMRARRPSPDFISPGFKKDRPLSNTLQSFLLQAEEASPLHILKTLQLSSFTSLLVETIDESHEIERHIKGSSIQAYSEYYKNLVFNNSGVKLSSLDIDNGFILKQGKLYQANGDGSIGKELLGHAKIINTTMDMGENTSPNRIFRKFANIHGANIHYDDLLAEPFAIVGGKTKQNTFLNWAKAYGRFSSEIGFKVLDNPAGFIEELAGNFGMADAKIFKTEGYKKLHKLLNVQLGTNGNYDLGLRESTKIMTKNIALKSLALYTGYTGINALLDKMTSDDNVWHKGILSGLANTYASVRIGIAEHWSDHFQNYKKAQENAAPESTSLGTLIGFPLAGAMMGGSLAYGQRLLDNGRLGTIASTAKHTELKQFEGLAGEALSKIGLNKEATTLGRYARLGAIGGAILAAPFLPGALIGSSSQELKDEYYGNKEVAVRNARFWMFGGNAYEGGSISYFRKSLIAETIKDAKDKTLYKNSSEKRDLDPIWSPLKYLKNPYAFEEKHQNDMPYPVWGMDVTYGSFLGKIFQGTIGQIIKPTVINPEFLKQTQGAPNTVDNPKSGYITVGTTQVKPAGFFSRHFGSGEPVVVTKSFKVKNGELPTPYHKVNAGGFQGENGDYPTPVNVKDDEASLIAQGLMLQKPSAHYNPKEAAAIGMYSALSDFTGLKGFTSNQLLEAMHMDPEKQMRPQLAVSGSARTAKDTIKNAELGDVGFFGEFLRRLIPQSAGTNVQTINPMYNKMAASWMPHDESKYYKDFRKGNYYDLAARGETMLPGTKGFEEMNPELKGVDIEKLPLVYRYKILQNVANGSSQHIEARKAIFRNFDKLNDKEREVFFEAYDQEQQRKQEKKFFEYKTNEEKSRMGLIQRFQNSLWESVSHRQSPTEFLLPFRPMSKFVHQRTAIEDYRQTHFEGSDAAIWTSPMEHFIKPAFRRAIHIFNKDYVPEEVREKQRVDEYFDKLKVIKGMKEHNPYTSQTSLTALAYLGINDKNDLGAFRRALPDDQKAYVESFAREKSAKKRQEILAMLPKDIGRGYQSIWGNIDTYDRAKQQGKDPKKALLARYAKQTDQLAKQFNITLTQEEIEGINEKATHKRTEESAKAFVIEEKQRLIRMKAAEAEAKAYIENQTGKVPADNWIGWDKRITIDDIKLKTLTIGHDDAKKYGYWKQDQERNDRIVAFKNSDKIVGDLDQIKREIKATRKMKHDIVQKLRRHGFETYNVESIPSDKNSIRIEDRSERH